ncbi:MAG: L,D-transpeptidase family protein [Armatimonadetes bacterium]|nr:L,D-transpeptidase family protein [Armatimonadota bacterium]
MTRQSRRLVVLVLLGATIALGARFFHRFEGGEVVKQKLRGQATVADRLTQFGPVARGRWKPYFERAGVPYPPQKLIFLGLKEEKRLEIYASNGGDWKWIRTLPILRASGKIGPKLREGDRQVPEGFYSVESVNPNSAYHLALRVNYPNESDREIAAREGRDNLGGNIMIHGSNASIGCLAMGDEGAEDLFVLAEDAGRFRVEIVLSPLDFRSAKLPLDSKRPAWLREHYAKLAQFVQTLPRDPH